MARTEFAVAIASILIVAGVLAIPLAAPTQTSNTPAFTPHPLSTPSATPTPTAAALGGPGCAAYAAKNTTGQGSILSMSQEPVAIALSNNPLTTSFASAIWGKTNTALNMVAKLDSGPYTVFAPVDAAWAKLPAAQQASYKTAAGAKALATLVQFHIVKGQLEPADVDGLLPTLDGGMVTVKGSGNTMTVDSANLVCGFQTANATLYLIDTVLTPTS